MGQSGLRKFYRVFVFVMMDIYVVRSTQISYITKP